MPKRNSHPQNLKLRAGELVEVRSPSEILRTLDERGTLEALPFMPEMLKYCGNRFRVYKRADKSCDTIDCTGSRRMYDTVHLEGLRCDGEAHGGCHAGCLLFWKEAWLKRIAPDEEKLKKLDQRASFASDDPAPSQNGAVSALLVKNTRVEAIGQGANEIRYTCQATEHKKASSALAWWDMRQYVRDIKYNRISFWAVMRAFMFWLFTKTLKLGAYRAQLRIYIEIQKRRGGVPYPFKNGTLTKTPSEQSHLQPGELVQIKSHEEILQTINIANRNRGLSFDVEMVKYCGDTYRVLRRVEKIINEKTGKMMQMPNDCIILEGVTCCADFSHKRLFCPRSIYPFWREIWLKRVAREEKEQNDIPAFSPYLRETLNPKVTV
jgi:hypothetical protein